MVPCIFADGIRAIGNFAAILTGMRNINEGGPISDRRYFRPHCNCCNRFKVTFWTACLNLQKQIPWALFAALILRQEWTHTAWGKGPRLAEGGAEPAASILRPPQGLAVLTAGVGVPGLLTAVGDLVRAPGCLGAVLESGPAKTPPTTEFPTSPRIRPPDSVVTPAMVPRDLTSQRAAT